MLSITPNENINNINNSNDNCLRVKRLSENAVLPNRASDLSAGYDLSSASIKPITLKAGCRTIIPTDLQIACPPGTYGRIAPRSGLSVKFGIHVGAGVVDADFRGSVGVVLFNLGQEDFTIQKGDRIAQLILEEIKIIPIVEVGSDGTLDMTERGDDGFGSTGGITAIAPSTAIEETSSKNSFTLQTITRQNPKSSLNESENEHEYLERICIDDRSTTRFGTAVQKSCFVCCKYLSSENKTVHRLTPFCCKKCKMPLCKADLSNIRNPALHHREMSCLMEHMSADQTNNIVACQGDREHHVDREFPKEEQIVHPQQRLYLGTRRINPASLSSPTTTTTTTVAEATTTTTTTTTEPEETKQHEEISSLKNDIRENKSKYLERICRHDGSITRDVTKKETKNRKTVGTAIQKNCCVCRQHLSSDNKPIHHLTSFCCRTCKMPLCKVDRNREMSCLLEHITAHLSNKKVACKGDRKVPEETVFPKEGQIPHPRQRQSLGTKSNRASLSSSSPPTTKPNETRRLTSLKNDVSGNEYKYLERIRNDDGSTTRNLTKRQQRKRQKTTGVSLQKSCSVCRKYLSSENKPIYRLTSFCCISCKMPLCKVDRSSTTNPELYHREMSCLIQHILECKGNIGQQLNTEFPNEEQILHPQQVQTRITADQDNTLTRKGASKQQLNTEFPKEEQILHPQKRQTRRSKRARETEEV